jgi:homopolymeric O-antigen transport system permease protein
MASGIRRTGAGEMLRMLRRYRRILWTTTVLELRKRYAGSAFGSFWVFLMPALMLGIYVFVYMVVFRVRFPQYSEYDYVLYVFAGLVPYLGVMDALAQGAMSVKQNIHLVKNVVLPLDLIPLRAVVLGMTSQFASAAVFLVMLAIGHRLSLHLLWLPVVFVLEYLMLAGLVLVLSALAVVLLDVSYFVNLALLLLIFISPIGFMPDMVPPALKLILTFNPLYYLIETFRAATFYGHFPPPHIYVGFTAISVVFFVLGAAFFRRFKGVLVDYE